MDMSVLLDSMFAVAKAVAPVVAGSKGAETVALAERVIEMIDHAREEIPAHAGPSVESQIEELVVERDAIEAAICAHVDQTAARLRGQ